MTIVRRGLTSSQIRDVIYAINFIEFVQSYPQDYRSVLLPYAAGERITRPVLQHRISHSSALLFYATTAHLFNRTSE